MDRLLTLYNPLYIGTHKSDRCGVLYIAGFETSSLSINQRDQAGAYFGVEPIRLAPVDCRRYLERVG